MPDLVWFISGLPEPSTACPNPVLPPSQICRAFSRLWDFAKGTPSLDTSLPSPSSDSQQQDLQGSTSSKKLFPDP